MSFTNPKKRPICATLACLAPGWSDDTARAGRRSCASNELVRFPVKSEGVHGIGQESTLERDEEVLGRQRLVIDRDAAEARFPVVVSLRRDTRHGCLKRGLDATAVIPVGLYQVR